MSASGSATKVRSPPRADLARRPITVGFRETPTSFRTADLGRHRNGGSGWSSAVPLSSGNGTKADVAVCPPRSHCGVVVLPSGPITVARTAWV